MQIVFAGKAHPADDTGKHHLQGVYRRALDPAFGGRVAFVEDYDLHVAHFLVQGCDVWLNNPRKPLEASGTSGMKACMNGVPHLSIGDGWWAEGFNGRNGWLIDGHAPPDDEEATDRRRRRLALSPARDRDRAGLLRPRRLGTAAPLGARREGGDPLGDARLQHPPHGEGLRHTGSTCRRCGERRVPELVPLTSCGKIVTMSRKSSATKARCALCGAKEVSEPRGDERYCRDCWDKKIAVEEIVAREFALKRYIRAHSAEKYLVYHSTVKRPCGQLIVVDDGYDLFLTLVLYPTFAWDEAAYHLEGDPEGRMFSEILVDVIATESHRAVGRRQVAHGDLPVGGDRNRKTGTARCRRAGQVGRVRPCQARPEGARRVLPKNGKPEVDTARRPARGRRPTR